MAIKTDNETNETLQENKPEKKARPGFNLEERVPVSVPRGAGDLYVSCAGKNYLLPEGKTSYVPRKVALEVKRAEHAKDLLAAEMEKRQQPLPGQQRF